MRLITLRFSHFNERARWALDRFRVTYEEEPYMPLLQVPAVFWATRGRGGRADRHSSRYSTPVLVLDDGRCLCDSAEIVRWADENYGTPPTTLYPRAQRAEIEVMERELEKRLGGDTRRVAYFLLLGQPGLLSALAERNVGPAQARLFKLVAPAVITVIRRALRIDAVGYKRSLERVRQYLDELGARIEGRSYLFGEQFTAADLTLASLLAPAYLPSHAEGYGGYLPELEELEDDAAAIVASVRQHPVGRYCLRLFATERGSRQPPAKLSPTLATPDVNP
jgi:glutathione S-transferase